MRIRPPRNIPLALVALSLLAAGCDGGPEPEPEPTAEELACADLCAAAKERGCPANDDCNDNCLSQFELGCSDLLLDFLACATPLLADDCSPREADGAHACVTELAGYDNCVSVDMGAYTECGPSVGQSDGIDPACVGSLECAEATFAVECDAAGACTCRKDGDVVGTCQNILASAYFCPPHAGCCTPFFAP